MAKLARKQIEVEFIKDTTTRHVGDRRWYDEGSASSFVTRGEARATGRSRTVPRLGVPGQQNTIDLNDGRGVWGEAAWRDDTPWVQVGEIMMPARVEVTMPGSANLPALSMTIEVRRGVPSFSRVCVEATEDAAVIGEHLRLVRDRMLGWLDRIVAALAARREPEPGALPSWADPSDGKRAVKAAKSRRTGRSETTETPKRRRMTPEFLAGVASTYRDNIEDKPLEKVSLVYQVEYRTAARWIELCRSDKHGLLPKTAQGKKKA
ncbi:hypothetical protein [Mycolicibacterium arseniciresistens]|uniref:Uncharacterized protein n=1 Tax=Mycolicibacterium arseniciresistens TaxID=3062257 RepID=A0ABT8UHZ1_9MYCO|nr:hypothetical protein [Mycolicibacterium arseniciresistens]MDO3636013.1 hypothetical protein [Mycolicibacterium arseniciresistens]